LIGCYLQETDYFTPQGEFRVDAAGSPTLLNCLMYKLSYFRFGELQVSADTFVNYIAVPVTVIGRSRRFASILPTAQDCTIADYYTMSL